jgi:hypothetical protein
MSQADAMAAVASAPGELADLLDGLDGRQTHPDRTWSVGAYVCHVADNLRIWAERLAGVASGDPHTVAPYDQDLLAEARHYGEVGLEGALWSLAWAVPHWIDAVVLADTAGVVLAHPDRGEQSVIDVVRSNAHDTVHHMGDIRTMIGRTP